MSEKQGVRYPCAAYIGVKIQQLREAQGVSIRGLAKKAMMPHTQLLKIEAGTTNSPIETLARIAEALEVPLSVLVDMVNEGQGAPDVEDNEYYQLFKELCQRIALPRERRVAGDGQAFLSRNQGALYQKPPIFVSHLSVV